MLDGEMLIRSPSRYLRRSSEQVNSVGLGETVESSDLSWVNSFVPPRQLAQLRVDFEIAAGLRTVVVMLAAFGMQIQPDTGQQIEMLIRGHSITNRLQPFFRNLA